ncbi:MAG TPA: ABC transporter permease [Spirillospora sp.]
MIAVRRAGNRRVLAGLVLLVALVALVLGGPLAAPSPWDEVDVTAFHQGPSARHWLGTTQGGRDVFALTLRGARTSMLAGAEVAVVATGLAAVVGAVAGYAGGRVDRVLMLGTDLLLVLPSFLVVAVLAPRLPGGPPVLMAVVAALMWMVTARAVRAMTLSLRRRGHVLAARTAGVSAPRIVVRHVLPHLASLLAVDASLNVGLAIAAESGLSYLGFGVRPPEVSLGTLIADGQADAAAHPWPFGFAAGLLVLVVLAVNLLGDGLRDAFAPDGGGR